MPKLVPRADALRTLDEERRAGAPRRAKESPPACLMCAIQERCVGPVYALFEDDDHLVMLPRYVRRWGQILVTPRRHVTDFAAVDEASWLATQRLVLRAAKILEECLTPKRVYIASTGSSAGEITQSSTHVHVHVIPLYDSDDRPASIFSWQEGVYTGEVDEWLALQAQLRDAWLR